MVSPSASSGQALSNHERPLHRPACPNLLALPPSYRRPPVFKLWAPTRPNRGPAASAPRQPAPPQKPAPQPPPSTPAMPVEDLPRTRSGARIQSCPGLHPHRAPRVTPASPAGIQSSSPNPLFNPPKCTPRRLKSFLEKTLTRARPPQNRPAAPHRPQPPFVRFLGQNLESAIT